MLYRVHLIDDADGSQGYVYKGSLREAKIALRDWRNESPDTRQVADIDSAPTPRKRVDVIRLLSLWGSHADNG